MVTAPGKNPYVSEAAIQNSGYAQFVDGVLVLGESGEQAPALADRVHGALRALILDPEFPCVGSRSAFNQGSYRFAMYKQMNSPESTVGLARDLYTFVQGQLQIEGDFTTFIACFDAPKSLPPEEFEAQLWEQLHALHQLDHEPWDPVVESDPQNPRFSFCFAGARSSSSPLAHGGTLGAEISVARARLQRTLPVREAPMRTRFEMMRDTIRERDEKLEGEVKPQRRGFRRAHGAPSTPVVPYPRLEVPGAFERSRPAPQRNTPGTSDREACCAGVNCSAGSIRMESRCRTWPRSPRRILRSGSRPAARSTTPETFA